MNAYVSRTCSKIDTESGAITGEPRPLSDFDDCHAYVLLGDPGAGKTTTFQQEVDRLSGTSKYLSARDFSTFHVDSHPEWQNKTLFIDGLDEMRVSTTNSRTPLDNIRGRLDQLGQPKFRLSCREADWLGNNDLQSLQRLYNDSQVLVLRLDPLNSVGILALLKNVRRDDPEAFIQEAQQRGLGPLLRNPQTLYLLAKAVTTTDGWPKDRMSTFEIACQQMAVESNEEHRLETISASEKDIHDAAGYLCTLLLLCDVEGISLSKNWEEPSAISLHDLGDLPASLTLDLLKSTLATRLFTAIGEQCQGPVHRQIAEFLAARWLSNRIADGLPPRRIMSLLGASNGGRVVTPLRGLSAWLATHSSTARRLLIENDPIGVCLYGDLAQFSGEDKKFLLEQCTREGSLLSHETINRFTGNPAFAFRSLASATMLPSIQALLDSSSQATGYPWTVEFVLHVLTKAEKSELQALGQLNLKLKAIIENPKWPPYTRQLALDAFLHIMPDSETRADYLFCLLQDTKNGKVPDPDDGLCGTLLAVLYPKHLTPSEMWNYTLPHNRSNYFGRLAKFWHFDLLRYSNDTHIAELLDSLYQSRSQIMPALIQTGFDDIPVKLLDRGLEAYGDSIELSRLFNWLITPRPLPAITIFDPDNEPTIKMWLEERPDIQKSLFLTWIRRCKSNSLQEVFEHWNCDALHQSQLPPDFGWWCLEKALEVATEEPLVSEELFRQAYHSLDEPSISEGLTLDDIGSQAQNNETLTTLFAELVQSSARQKGIPKWQTQERELRAKHHEEQLKRQLEWQAILRSAKNDLQQNRLSPAALDTLAIVYLGTYSDVNKDISPRDRISQLIGGDTKLVDDVITALREAVFRDDLPEEETIIELMIESRYHCLSNPVLASMRLIAKDNPARLDVLSASQKRMVLAMGYSQNGFHLEGSTPSYLDRWLDQDPDQVFDVLYQCAIATLKVGDNIIPGLKYFDDLTDQEERVTKLKFKLLEAFPTRAPKKQFPLLDRLLGQAVRHPDSLLLLPLVNRKLGTKSMTNGQRIRWLTVGAILSPQVYRESLIDFIGNKNERTRHLAEFLRDSAIRSPLNSYIASECSDPMVLATIIKILGCLYDPLRLDGLVTLEIAMSNQIEGLIWKLGSIPSKEAHDALTNLVDDPLLASWQEYLQPARERQLILLWDTSYVHPSLNHVQEILSSQN
ncbi:NACHT domain-containing protein [Candidatus Poriferisocius sp.]|uniref:NACHT domain-containing protein n=1 Tax=Candidatus Poriferisocius sp. TaxID=3101276 RepID=UPI003B01A976